MTSLSLFVFIFSQTQTNQQHKIISNKRKNHHTSLSRLTRGVKKKNCLKMMQRKANPTMRSTAALINSANAKRCIETSFFFHSYFFNSSFFFAFLGNSEGSRYGCLSVVFSPLISPRDSSHAALEIRAESIFFFLFLLLFLLQSVVFVSIVDDARDFFFTFFVVVVVFPNIFV